jgi:hypothetical protein
MFPLQFPYHLRCRFVLVSLSSLPSLEGGGVRVAGRDLLTILISFLHILFVSLRDSFRFVYGSFFLQTGFDYRLSLRFGWLRRW